MSERTTRSHRKTANAGNVSTVPVTNEADAQPPSTKRARTQKGKKLAAHSSRKRGRLSVLPSLPLDVLFEIFGHLGPADLLHLARTTKSFRSVLLSPQSIFLWKDVCAATDEINDFPCPEEMALPKWINLVHGGPFCDEVGCSGRAHKVLWGLRRRLCKSCQEKLLISPDDVWSVLGIEVMMLLDGMTDSVPREVVTRNGRSRDMYLRSDIEAIKGEVRALAKTFDYEIEAKEYPAPKGSPEWQAALTAFKIHRKSLCDARLTHATRCSLVEEAKTAERDDELDALKDARFLDAKQRLMAMGFDAADAGANAIRVHKEVKQPKPLTDRVWIRIGPILRAEAERIRDERLERERCDRMTLRVKCARRRYEHITLSNVAPSTVCFAPRHDVVFRLPRIAAYLREDAERLSSQEADACAAAFAEADIPALANDWITHRQASLRAKLPDSWPRMSATNEDIGTHWPTRTEPAPAVDRYAQLANLDLAIYAFKCGGSGCYARERVFYGLDILAHACLDPDEVGDTAIPHELDQPNDFVAIPLPDYHTATLRVIQLLELDPTKARPVDCDKLDRFFTAEPRGPHDRGQAFMTWRQAVHASATWCQPDTLRLVDDREKAYIEKYHDTFRDGSPMHPADDETCWTCSRCAHVADPAGVEADHEVLRWTRLQNVRSHLILVHGITDAEEGVHYFYNRCRDRVKDDDEAGDREAFTRLPRGVELDAALNALNNLGNTDFSPLNLMQMMLAGGGQGMFAGGQGPPFWLMNMMVDLLGFAGDLSDDSDEWMDF